MTSATVAALESSLSDGAVAKIRDALQRHVSGEIVLNLVQLDIDGARGQVTVRYFVDDPGFPDVTLSFAEVDALLDRC